MAPKRQTDRRNSEVSAVSGRQSLYTADTTITDATFLKGGEDAGHHLGVLDAMRAATEEKVFASLDALTSHRTVSNRLSTLAILAETSQLITIVTSGRFAEKWDFELPYSTLSLGYFESSFGVLSACYVGVLVLMVLSFTATSFVSAGSKNGIWELIWKAYILRWLLLAFLAVGYLPASVIMLRIPAMCLPWLENAPRDTAGRLLAFEYADEGLLCGSPQSLLMSFVGVLTAVVLVNASVVLKAVYHDTNPTSKSIQARSHSRVAVVEVVVRTLLAIVFVISNSVVGDIILMALVIVGGYTLTILSFVYLPYYSIYVNMFKVFFATYLAVYGTILPLVYAIEADWTFARRFFVFGFAVVVGIVMVYLARRRARKIDAMHRPAVVAPMVLTESDSACGGDERSSDSELAAQERRLQETQSPRTLSRSEGLPPFARSTDVEIATRNLIASGNMDDAALVYERGLAQFPDSALVRLQYATFLIHTGAYTAGEVMIDRLSARAEAGELIYDLRFGIYALRKELARRRQTTGTMDVASYVKYNARLVEATRAHSAAMRHVHTLWSLVLRSDEEFLQRSHRLAESIDREGSRAEDLFVKLLQEYPNVTPILRAYALFLEEVQHDELKADKLRHHADILEGRRGRGGGGGGGGAGAADAGHGFEGERMVPNEEVDVVLTVTSQGRILSANHNVRLFGHSTETVVGASVYGLVAIEGTSIHAVMEGYNDGVKKSDLELVHGVDTDGQLLRLVADLTPVSAGSSPRFALVLRPVRHGAVVRYTADGTVLGATVGVKRLLGWRPRHMLGEPIDDYLPDVLDAVAAQRDAQRRTVTGRRSQPQGSGVIGDDGSSYSSSGSSSGSAARQVAVRNFVCNNRSGTPVSMEVLATRERRAGGGSLAVSGGRHADRGGGRVRLVALARSEDVCALRVARDGTILAVGDHCRNVLCRPRRMVTGQPVGKVLHGLTATDLRWYLDRPSSRVFSVRTPDGNRQLCTVAVQSSAWHLSGSHERSRRQSRVPTSPTSADGGLAMGSPTTRRVSRAMDGVGGDAAAIASARERGAFLVMVRLVGSDSVHGDLDGDGGGQSTLLSSAQRSSGGASMVRSSGGSGSNGSVGDPGSSSAVVRRAAIGGRVRRAHRFRVKSFVAIDVLMRWASMVASVAILGFFVYSLVVRSSLRQTPIRMGLHADRERALMGGITELRSAALAWGLAAHNLSAVAGLAFPYSASAYAAEVDAVNEISPVLFDGNGSVWSIFEAHAEYAEYWTNSSRASLSVASGTCSDATHLRNVTFEGAMDLMGGQMVAGLSMTLDEVIDCSGRASLPSPLHFLLRNALGDLRVAIREGLAREVDAGVSKLTLLKWNMLFVATLLGGLLLLSWPPFCIAVRRMRRERERAVLAFVNIPKTEVAAFATDTRRYGSGGGSVRKGTKGRHRQRKRERRRRERLRRHRRREAVSISAASLVDHETSCGGSVSPAEASGVAGEASRSGRCSDHSDCSASISRGNDSPGRAGRAPWSGRSPRQRRASRDSSTSAGNRRAYFTPSDSAMRPPSMTVSHSRGSLGVEDRRRSKRSVVVRVEPAAVSWSDVSTPSRSPSHSPVRRRTPSLPPSRGRTTSRSPMRRRSPSNPPPRLPPLSGSPLPSPKKARRRSGGKAKGRRKVDKDAVATDAEGDGGKAARVSNKRGKATQSVLKAASRTDYVPPSQPRLAWGTRNRPSADTDAHTRNLLKELAPSQGWVTVMMVALLVFTASGLLHFADTPASEARMANFATAVVREANAEYMLWIAREMWLSRAAEAGVVSIFAEAGGESMDARSSLEMHMAAFEAAHRELTNQPASAEEVLLRGECVADQLVAANALNAATSGAGEAGFVWDGSDSVDNSTHCVTPKLAYQLFLHTISTMMDTFDDPAATAEDAAAEMEFLWELGNEAVIGSLIRSSDNYFDAASDYSQGLQTVIFAIQNLLFLCLTMGLFRKYADAYYTETERLMHMLRIIPHRVAETSLEMEEYLRTLE